MERGCDFNGGDLPLGGRTPEIPEEPNWANSLLARLVEEKLVEVNERGHYRYIGVDEAQAAAEQAAAQKAPPKAAQGASLVGDNYFPSKREPEAETEFYLSPQIREILRNSGKKFGN